LLNVAYVLAACIRDGPLVLQQVIFRIALEGLLVASAFRALTRGRYPTLVEIGSVPVAEHIISISLCWLLVAVAIAVGWEGVRWTLRRLSSWQKSLTAGLIGLSVTVWLLLPALPAPASARIVVDTNASIGPMPQHHRGFSQGGETEMQESGYFEGAMDRLAPLGPRFVRIDHIYDYYGVYRVSEGGEPTYDWAEVDRVVDAVLATGAEPLICLSYLPRALARESIYGPPADFGAWESLIYQTVYYLNVERGLGISYWEVWNEPNLPAFWNGTLDEYLQLYAATARGALRADPSIQLGGPGTASMGPWLHVGAPFYERNWVKELAHFARANDLPLDFLSWHYYDLDPEHYAWSVRTHQRWVTDLDPAPRLLLTEWNWSGAPASELDTEVGAAHAVAVLATLADTPLTQAFFFEPVDSSTGWEGRWGMMRKDRVIKPVYNSFYLASKLGGRRITTHSDHPHVGALATRDEAGIAILMWRYGGREGLLPVTLSVTGLPSQTALTIIIQGVGAEDGSLYPGTDSDRLLIGQETTRIPSTDGWGTTINLPTYGVRLVQLQMEN
jgi:hypothetical protein